MNKNKDMQIVISPSARAKIDHWVKVCPKEISGMGSMQVIGDKIYIEEAFLLEQEVTGSETEIDAAALGKLEFEHRKSGAKGTLNFWWHSHVNMGLFWSGVDHAQMAEFASTGFIVASVFVKSGGVQSAYRQGGGDFYPPIFIDHIDTVTGSVISKEESDALTKEYKKKVKEKVYKQPANGAVSQFRGNNYTKHDATGYWDNVNRKWVEYDEPRLPLDDVPATQYVEDEPAMLDDEQIIAEWAGICQAFYGSATDEEVIDFYENYGDDKKMIDMAAQINTQELMESNNEVH